MKEIEDQYIFEYLDENDFRKKERSIRKYSKLAYKKLTFNFYPALRVGNFIGEKVSEDESKNTASFELKLPTDERSALVHGDIMLHYTVYYNKKIILLTNITPEEILDEIEDIAPGLYALTKDADSIQIRAGAPIGQYVIEKASGICLSPSAAKFDLTHYPYHSSTLERFKGESGYCIGYRINASNSHDNEEELIICGVSDDGELTPDDFGKKLLELDVAEEYEYSIPSDVEEQLNDAFEETLKEYKADLADRIQTYLNAEIDKLYAWADDNMYPLEDEVVLLRRQRDALRRSARKSSSPSERVELKRQEIAMSKKLSEAQAKCEEARAYYNAKSEEQIEAVEKSLKSNVTSELFFIVRWTLI